MNFTNCLAQKFAPLFSVLCLLFPHYRAEANPQSYWLECYGGALAINEAADPPLIDFNIPGSSKALFFAPGMCRWPNRAFRPDELPWPKQGRLVYLPLDITKYPLPKKDSIQYRPKERETITSPIPPARKDVKGLLFAYARETSTFRVRVYRQEIGLTSRFVVVDVDR